jgi:DNA-binding CsgD family transcriptional regulator
MLLWFPLKARTALPRTTARRWELVAKQLLDAFIASSKDDGETTLAGTTTEQAIAGHGAGHLMQNVRSMVDGRPAPILSHVEACSFRSELLRGEWRFLDQFDRDGRRYFAWTRGRARGERRQSLTKRERDVLERVARGHSDRAIAMDLRCSSSTVATHRLRAMSKLGLRSRAVFSQILASVASDEAS